MKWIKSLVVFFFLLYIFFQPNLDNLIYFTSGTCFQDGTSSVYYVLYSGLICFAPKGAVVGCHLEKKKKKVNAFRFFTGTRIKGNYFIKSLNLSLAFRILPFPMLKTSNFNHDLLYSS